MEHAVDERSEPRFVVDSREVWLQWKAGGTHFGTLATLFDISRHGARVISPLLPDAGQGVSLHLAESEPPAWAPAVVAASERGPRLHSVRLRFRESCPVALFEEAVRDAEIALLPI